MHRTDNPQADMEFARQAEQAEAAHMALCLRHVLHHPTGRTDGDIRIPNPIAVSQAITRYDAIANGEVD